MTANVTNETKQENDRPSLWIGILLIAIGLIGIFLPNFSTLVVETWLSLMLTTAGGAKLAYAFSTRQQGGFIWKLLLSILYIATGVMLFFNPLNGILTLTLLLGGFLLAEGVFEIILAFRLRPRKYWTSALINGIITLAIGLMIGFQWPFNAPWLLGTFVGASILVTGISRLMLALNGNSSASLPPTDSTPSVTGA